MGFTSISAGPLIFFVGFDVFERSEIFGDKKRGIRAVEKNEAPFFISLIAVMAIFLRQFWRGRRERKRIERITCIGFPMRVNCLRKGGSGIKDDLNLQKPYNFLTNS